MKQAPALFNSSSFIFKDKNHILATFMARQLDMNINSITIYSTFGLIVDNKLVGIILYSDYTYQHDIWLSIYTLSPLWAQRKIIRFILRYAFDVLKCHRISALVKSDNVKSQHMLKRLNFKREGWLRQFDEKTQKDCYIYSLLPGESPYQL